MADYYPLIVRAIANLPQNTDAARRVLYERAREVLIAQLRAQTPALTEAEVTRESQLLDEAICRAESEINDSLQSATIPPSASADEPDQPSVAIVALGQKAISVGKRMLLIVASLVAVVFAVAVGLLITAPNNSTREKVGTSTAQSSPQDPIAQQVSSNDKSDIFSAATGRQVGEVKALIAKDKSVVNARDKEGNTPLILLVNSDVMTIGGPSSGFQGTFADTGKTDEILVASLLLDAGADINARNDD